MEPLSVYGGTGFVGSEFCRRSRRPVTRIAREARRPVSSESVYFISTTHNYHVFDDLQRDVDVNLRVLLEVLGSIEDRPGHVFNFISSWFVYGDTTLPATEDAVCSPKGFYSITKRCAEELLVSFCETFGMRYRILRLCNVYGPGDASASKQKNALQYLIERLKQHEPIQLYHDGYFTRDYMHVTDVARAIDLVVNEGPTNQVFNIGSGDATVFRDLMTLARDICGSRSTMGTMEPPPFHRVVQVKDFAMDTSRLRALGFRPETSLEQGISELCR